MSLQWTTKFEILLLHIVLNIFSSSSPSHTFCKFRKQGKTQKILLPTTSLKNKLNIFFVAVSRTE